MKESKALYFLRYLFIGLLLIVFLFPLFYVVNTSLRTQADFLKNTVGIVSQFRFQNYIDAIIKAKFGSYSLNSLFYVIVVVVISLTISLFLAFPLARKFFKFTGFIYTAFVLGMFLPNGIIPLWQMIFKAGLYDTRLGYILTLINGGGVTLFFFVAYIKNIPKDFDEAASLDGCGYITYIFKILVPLMKPAISSMAVLLAIGVWNEIINSIIFLTKDKYYPVTRGLYVFKGQYTVKWTLMAAALMVVAMPLVVLYVFMQRYIIDGVISGGIKS